jgi:O-succinylbenzoate synthase
MLEPFRISSGVVAEKDAIVVAIHSDSLTGYGECSPMSGTFYSQDTPEASWDELASRVGPATAGREFEGPEDWNRHLDALATGAFTKAGVETAMWDLAAQMASQPLDRFLGGTRSRVESGLAVGLYETIPQLLRTIERYLACGYRRVKLKIEPGRDVEFVRAAREQFSYTPMSVDANGAYTLKDREVFHALDDLDLMMFEQPFPASFLQESAELQREVRTPICLDESLDSADQLRSAIKLRSFGIANFKIQRIGGFHRALEMDSICRENSIPAWVGTMPELGIGQAQGAALASLANFTYPTDVEASGRWFSDDIVSPFIRVQSDGCIELPRGPGLGYQVDQNRIQRYKIASRSFPE